MNEVVDIIYDEIQHSSSMGRQSFEKIGIDGLIRKDTLSKYELVECIERCLGYVKC